MSTDGPRLHPNAVRLHRPERAAPEPASSSARPAEPAPKPLPKLTQAQMDRAQSLFAHPLPGAGAGPRIDTLGQTQPEGRAALQAFAKRVDTNNDGRISSGEATQAFNQRMATLHAVKTGDVKMTPRDAQGVQREANHALNLVGESSLHENEVAKGPSIQSLASGKSPGAVTDAMLEDAKGFDSNKDGHINQADADAAYTKFDALRTAHDAGQISLTPEQRAHVDRQYYSALLVTGSVASQTP